MTIITQRLAQDSKITYAEHDANHLANVVKFDSVLDLKTKSGDYDNQQGQIHSYYGDGNGGGGPVYWDATSTETPDDGMIFQVTGVATGRWKRPYGCEVNVQQFGAKGDGVTDDTAAFQNAVASLPAFGGGILHVKSSDYWFTVTGDADSITLPSNVIIECEPGTVFKWNYFGTPLFSLSASSNSGIRNAKFIWSGTYNVPAIGGSRAFQGNASLPSHLWACHITTANADNFILENLVFEGATTSNIINACIHLYGTPIGDYSLGGLIRNIEADDVCQVVIGGKRDGLRIEGIKQNKRYSVRSNGTITPDPGGLQYGPGHIIYITEDSKNLLIDNIDNSGAVRIEPDYQGGDHTLSIKGATNSIITRIKGTRDEGIVNFNTLDSVRFSNLDYETSSTNQDSTGSVYASPGDCTDLVFDNVDLRSFGDKNFCPFNLGLTSGASNLRPKISNLKITRNAGFGISNAAMTYVGQLGRVQLKVVEIGVATKNILRIDQSTSTDNVFELSGQGVNFQTQVDVTSLAANNIFLSDSDSKFVYSTANVEAAANNVFINRNLPQFFGGKTLASATSPSTTFLLPKQGAYMVNLFMQSGDANHAKSALYWVVWDNASANDFTTAQLMGTKVQKGSTVTDLSMTVDNTGTCSITSITTVSDSFIFRWGYRQLSGW